MVGIGREQGPNLMSSNFPKHLIAKKAKEFPNLQADDYFITSIHDWAYNCIAHAAGENHVPWWPMEEETEGVFWPDGVPRKLTIDAFVEAYKTKDYLALPFLGVATSKIALNLPHHLADTDNGPAHFLGGPVHVQQRPCPQRRYVADA